MKLTNNNINKIYINNNFYSNNNNCQVIDIQNNNKLNQKVAKRINKPNKKKQIIKTEYHIINRCLKINNNYNRIKNNNLHNNNNNKLKNFHLQLQIIKIINQLVNNN